MDFMTEIANIVGDYEVCQGRARPSLPVTDRLVELDVAQQNHHAGYGTMLADVYEALKLSEAINLGVR